MVLSETPGYEPVHPQYNFLFNSYYNALGPRWTRTMCGALSRPTVREVFSYRSSVDQHLGRVLRSDSEEILSRVSCLIEFGIHHEQQHQELLVTDIKAILAQSPMYPVYRPAANPPRKEVSPSTPEGFHGLPGRAI